MSGTITMIHEDGTFHGVKDHEIHYQAWPPAGKITASVQVVHGLAEHSGRYGNVIETLVPAGYAVIATDHYGHGKSNGTRKHVDIFEDFIEDEKTLHDIASSKFPAIDAAPRFLLGYSMGSFISFTWVAAHGGNDLFSGLVLCGFGLRLHVRVPKILQALAPVVARLAPKAVFNSGLSRDTFTHDSEVLAIYNQDPLVTDIGKVTARLGAHLIERGKRNAALAPNVRIPVLVQAGSEDDTMTGFEEIDAAFTGTTDKTITIYDGLYHEIYNERQPDRDRVLSDLRSWLDARATRSHG